MKEKTSEQTREKFSYAQLQKYGHPKSNPADLSFLSFSRGKANERNMNRRIIWIRHPQKHFHKMR